MVQGINQNKRNEIASDYQTDGTNGATVYLVGSTSAVNDGATSAPSTSNSDVASASTNPGDWSITHDNTSGTSTLTNSADIGFGSVSGFTVVQILIESPNNASNLIIDDSPSGDTDLSGSGDVSVPSGNLSYTLGSQ